MIRYALFLLISLVLSLTVHCQEFPGDTWEYDDIRNTTLWDGEKALDYYRYVRDSSKITGLLIVHKGKIILEYGDIEENSYIASCRKSVLAMLYGKYVENGTISLEKTIKELGIDDVEGILPVEQQATVKDLISARSGVYHPEGYPGGMQQFAPERGSVQPGEYWLYSNWDFNVAGFVFEQETEKNIYDEVQDQLAIPLNMQDWNRSLQQKQGDTTISKYLAYPMWFSTRDMARIGLLMMNKGNWNGKRLISEDWVADMLKQRTTAEELNTNVPVFREMRANYGYGYMWWLFENMNDDRFKDAYAALGAMGQAIAVFPEIDVVIAYKTKAAYRRVNDGNTRQELLLRAVELYKGE